MTAISGMGCSAIDRAFSGMGCSAIDRAFSLSSLGPLGPLSGQSSYLKYTMKSETYVVKGKRIMPAESIRPSSLRLSSTCPRYQVSLVFVEFVWGCHSQSLFIRSICIFLTCLTQIYIRQKTRHITSDIVLVNIHKKLKLHVKL